MAPSIPVWCGPYQYGLHHTGMVGAILVCWGPYQYEND